MNSIQQIIYKNDFNDPNKAHAIGFNALDFLFRTGIKLTVDGSNNLEKNLQPAHQYAVIKADDDYIYLKNPHYSSLVLKLKWSDLNRLSLIISEIKL